MLRENTINLTCSFCNMFTFLRTFGSSVRIIELVENKWKLPEGYDTGIMLYNRLLKEKVPFILKNNGVVNWYACGPTVYDSAHIGHACSYIRFDIIRRILENFFNLKVIQVMSITDIDDKIISRATRLEMDYKLLTRKYETEFFNDLRSLNILLPTFAARVTNFIPDIAWFIENLMEKNYAYESTDGSIYFDTRKFNRYGKLKPIVVNEANYDYEVLSLKRSIPDFALWKRSKGGEPFWETSIGSGRPGWHSECSAIATKFFGSNVDVHSGGVDLLQPHHESEEAQCCVYHNTEQWVNHWIHAGYLHLKGDGKMSKSLKNTIKISEFLEKYTHNNLRMLCLLCNYADYVEFSEETMSVALIYCEKFRNFFANCLSYINGIDVERIGVINEAYSLELIEKLKISIKKNLANDFDTHEVIKELAHVVKEINKMWEHNSTDIVVSRSTGTMLAVYDFLKTTLENFGISFETTAVKVDSLQQLQPIVDTAISFRTRIRELAVDTMKQNGDGKDKKELAKLLLKTCDDFREEVKLHKISIQDRGKLSSWSFLENAKTKDE